MTNFQFEECYRQFREYTSNEWYSHRGCFGNTYVWFEKRGFNENKENPMSDVSLNLVSVTKQGNVR